MNSDNLNWSDNRVLNQNTSRQSSYASTLRRTSPEVEPGEGTSAGGVSSPSPLMSEQGPPPVADRSYIPGYLASIIGKNVRAEFLLGNSLYIDRTGILREVGVNYFVLEDYITHARVMCDLYSVKFITTL